MKRIVIIFSLSLLAILQTYSKGELQTVVIANAEDKVEKVVEISKARKDTIVKSVVILRANQQMPKDSSTTNRGNSYNRRDDKRYDKENSGFFDEYIKNYDGDPNEKLKPIVKVVELKEAVDKKKEIEKTIDQLEEKNKERQEAKKRINEGIEKYNKEVEEENKAKDKKTDEQKKGKTLDTDLLINSKD